MADGLGFTVLMRNLASPSFTKIDFSNYIFIANECIDILHTDNSGMSYLHHIIQNKRYDILEDISDIISKEDISALLAMADSKNKNCLMYAANTQDKNILYKVIHLYMTYAPEALSEAAKAKNMYEKSALDFLEMPEPNTVQRSLEGVGVPTEYEQHMQEYHDMKDAIQNAQRFNSNDSETEK